MTEFVAYLEYWKNEAVKLRERMQHEHQAEDQRRAAGERKAESHKERHLHSEENNGV